MKIVSQVNGAIDVLIALWSLVGHVQILPVGDCINSQARQHSICRLPNIIRSERPKLKVLQGSYSATLHQEHDWKCHDGPSENKEDQVVEERPHEHPGMKLDVFLGLFDNKLQIAFSVLLTF